MGDRQPVYVEMSATLKEKLEKRIDELGVTKREYFEQVVREDTEHITLDDPKAELAEVERQLQAAHEELEELQDEKSEVRESIKELQQQKEKLEDRAQKSGIITATSYDEAIDALVERAVEDGIAETGTDVKRVAEEWARDPHTVCRHVFERSIRVRPEDVSVRGRFPSHEVPDEWEEEWPAYDEAVDAFAERVRADGVIHGGCRRPKTLADIYDRDFYKVAGDLIRAANVDEIQVVERDFNEDLNPSDAPGADLVVGDHVAEKIGLEES